MILLAVDPGMQGALAYINDRGDLLQVEDMPVVNKAVDPVLLWALFRARRPDAVVIEYQQAMPAKLRGRQQGGQSTFKTGTHYGMLLAAAAALEVPFTTRRSSDWKRRLHLTQDKEQSRAMALRTWPGHADSFRLKKHEGRAEAALLGLSMLIEQGKFQADAPSPKVRRRIVKVPVT